MGGPVIQLLILAVLIMVNGVLAGSELALVSLREGQVRRLAKRGGAGAAVARLVEDPNRFLSTIQIGITLAGFLASATAAVALAEPLVPYLGLFGSWAEPVAILLVTAVLTFVTLVFGELVPKRIAMHRAEGWALFAARPLSVFAVVTAPAVWLLGRVTNLVVRLVGLDPHEARESLTEEELRDMVVSQVTTLTPEEKRIISGALEFGDRRLSQILRPRTVVFALSADVPCEEGLSLLLASRHSRAPVHGEGGLDDLVGIVHLRDLIGAPGTVGAQAHPAPLFSETLPAVEALRLLQAAREQMAVVLDEYQGVSGIITVEDLLEEVVGEIYDEADRDVVQVRRLPDGSLLVPGLFPVHDLPDLGIEYPDGPYSTLNGLLQYHLQRLPADGDVLSLGSCRLEVQSVRGRVVARVKISAPEGAAEG